MTAESKPRFLDSLIGLFRDKPGEAPPTKPNEDRDFEAQRANFDAALHDLDEKAEEHRRQRAAASSAPGVSRSTAEERAAERERSSPTSVRPSARRSRLHEKLGTGVGTDLEALSASLEELAVEVDAGKDSHELVPRARARAVQRLQKEAGELALTRLELLWRRQDLEWPESTHPRPLGPAGGDRTLSPAASGGGPGVLPRAKPQPDRRRSPRDRDGLGLGLPASRLPPLGGDRS